MPSSHLQHHDELLVSIIIVIIIIIAKYNYDHYIIIQSLLCMSLPPDICTILNRPEVKTLKWSAADVEKYSEAARTIGAPLAEGEELFTELQNTSNHDYLHLAV